jgi:NAD+ synthase
VEKVFSPEATCQKIIAWLKERVVEAGAEGGVFGLSGGLDSAVVAALCREAFGDRILGVIMPCYSQPEDVADAELVAGELKIPTKTVDLSGIYRAMTELLTEREFSPEDHRVLAITNIKPRLRMITLYYWAAKLNYLVIGTSNRSEAYIGYSTKYGDSGVDLMPIAGLVKTQVRELAKVLGVPEPIITKAPSAGLWPGQTDEGEMGFSYADLDRFILTGQGEQGVVEAITRMHRRSSHKWQLPPQPEL